MTKAAQRRILVHARFGRRYSGRSLLRRWRAHGADSRGLRGLSAIDAIGDISDSWDMRDVRAVWGCGGRAGGIERGRVGL